MISSGESEQNFIDNPKYLIRFHSSLLSRGYSFYSWFLPNEDLHKVPTLPVATVFLSFLFCTSCFPLTFMAAKVLRKPGCSSGTVPHILDFAHCIPGVVTIFLIPPYSL